MLFKYNHIMPCKYKHIMHKPIKTRSDVMDWQKPREVILPPSRLSLLDTEPTRGIIMWASATGSGNRAEFIVLLSFLVRSGLTWSFGGSGLDTAPAFRNRGVWNAWDVAQEMSGAKRGSTLKRGK
jgi:hypothetical protein